VELSDAVQLVVVHGLPVRVAGRCPAGPGLRADHQRAELVEGENPLREMVGPIVDAGQLRLAVRVGGLFPRCPPAEASTTMARRNRIGEPVPRRVMRSSC
jgi:hypothetical protein